MGQDISLTEALGVFTAIAPSDSGKKRWKWALECSLDLFACVCTRKFSDYKIIRMVQIFVDLIFDLL